MNKGKGNNTNFDECAFQQYTKINTKLLASGIKIKLKLTTIKLKMNNVYHPLVLYNVLLSYRKKVRS